MGPVKPNLKWVEALSDSAVQYAAEQWQVLNSEAFGVLQAAVEEERLSERLLGEEFREFVEYVKTEINSPTIPPKAKEEPKTQPRKRIIPQRQTKKLPTILDEIDVARFLVYGFWALCLISFAMMFINPKITQTEKPSVTLYPTFTDEDFATMKARRACEQDVMNGVPDEYSRCFDNPTPPPDQDPIDPYACPYGCSTHKVGCDIKGNIAFDTEEKIYHVPGQKYYAQTTIDPTYGEAWFCTEEEALSNGWRKAYQ